MSLCVNILTQFAVSAGRGSRATFQCQKNRMGNRRNTSNVCSGAGRVCQYPFCASVYTQLTANSDCFRTHDR